jgi:hypothetical protein
MTDDDPTPRARHLSVLQEIVTLFDSLPPKAQKEVLAFLAASQGVVIKEPTAPRSSYGYRYGAKRGK